MCRRIPVHNWFGKAKMRISFRFSLGSLFLATTLIAVLIGLLSQVQKYAASAPRARAIRELKELGATAVLAYDRPAHPDGVIVWLMYPKRACESRHFQWAADVGGLEWLDLRDTSFQDADAPTLLANPCLKVLHLADNPGVTDETLRIVGQLPLLERLHLDHTGITDQGLAELGRLTKLRTLTLYRTAITSQGLASLRRLQSLGHLSLTATYVDDSGLGAIGEIHSLEEILLDDTKVRGSGLATLAKLPKLRLLKLSDCYLQDGSGLAELKQVSNLEIRRGHFSPGVLSHIAEMDNLRSLVLSWSDVGDKELTELSSAKQLIMLELWGTNASEAALQDLKSKLPNTEVRGDPKDP